MMAPRFLTDYACSPAQAPNLFCDLDPFLLVLAARLPFFFNLRVQQFDLLAKLLLAVGDGRLQIPQL